MHGADMVKSTSGFFHWISQGSAVPLRGEHPEDLSLSFSIDITMGPHIPQNHGRPEVDPRPKSWWVTELERLWGGFGNPRNSVFSFFAFFYFQGVWESWTVWNSGLFLFFFSFSFDFGLIDVDEFMMFFGCRTTVTWHAETQWWRFSPCNGLNLSTGFHGSFRPDFCHYPMLWMMTILRILNSSSIAQQPIHFKPPIWDGLMTRFFKVAPHIADFSILRSTCDLWSIFAARDMKQWLLAVNLAEWRHHLVPPCCVSGDA